MEGREGIDQATTGPNKLTAELSNTMKSLTVFKPLVALQIEQWELCVLAARDGGIWAANACGSVLSCVRTFICGTSDNIPLCLLALL